MFASSRCWHMRRCMPIQMHLEKKMQMQAQVQMQMQMQILVGMRKEN